MRVCIYCSFCFCLCCSFHLSAVHYNIFLFNFIFLFEYLPSLMHAFCFSNQCIGQQVQTQTSRSCTKPLWNANMAYYTVYDALLQCNTSALPTCHTLITSTNGTVTALPPTSVSMTTATKTALTRSEACFCHPETFCFLSCLPEDTFGSPLCQVMGSMISHPLIHSWYNDWSRVTTQRKDKTQMRSLWYYNYFSNKTIGKAKGDCQWKSNQTGVCCFLNTSHCE